MAIIPRIAKTSGGRVTARTAVFVVQAGDGIELSIPPQVGEVQF